MAESRWGVGDGRMRLWDIVCPLYTVHPVRSAREDGAEEGFLPSEHGRLLPGEC